ncbi:polymorphic toxin-type HINT domain-containing protein [Fodinicola feengrottensis]|uniref:polymorphic toxin-type HINT domain-containing protein n=1 Tax=Fodinicola feengrottensis TaxID=435914 RepID=UPI0036F24B20
MVQAAWLAPGDKLLQPDGATSTVEKISNSTGRAPTYNLTIGDTHTYYVASSSSSILVHNCPDISRALFFASGRDLRQLMVCKLMRLEQCSTIFHTESRR